MIDSQQKPEQTAPGQAHYALCVRNEGFQASLELRKIYRLVPAKPSDMGMARVVDESGEDYLYPPEFFIALDLPLSAEQALAAIS